MISSTLPRVTRIAVIGGASVRAGRVAQAVAQIPNVEIVEVPVEEKREPVSMPVASARKDPKSRPRGVPFRITHENREAWQGGSGRARGILVDGLGNVSLKGRRGIAHDSFDSLASLIRASKRDDETGASAKAVLAMPYYARVIRSRPRLKAMLGGAA